MTIAAFGRAKGQQMGPVTRVGVTVTFLRMDQAPKQAAPGLAAGFQIVRARSPSVAFYRYLYNTVGADYVWWLRRTAPDEELAALLRDPAVGIHTLYADGEPVGFFELDARSAPDVNLSYFGLMPRAIGIGAGYAFLRTAIDEAWRRGARGMTVNTCTADHPRALPTYLRAGFHIVRQGKGGLERAQRARLAHSGRASALTAEVDAPHTALDVNDGTVAEPLALYIHWPFCLAKCPYCDFNSHVRDRIDQDRFGAALRRELATEALRLGRRRLTSVFFGGGTPSLMNPGTVAALLDDAARLFEPAGDIEITLEANPTSVEAGRLRGFRAAGVNRISMGIQSLDADALRALGREHSVAEAIAALTLARRVFPRVSFDLIYARPGQTVEAWQAELRAALAIAADHLSLYQLTIEPGTKFEALHRQGRIVLPDDEVGADLYHATAGECANAGLYAYEISNYAVPGGESRHNLAYWRYLDYAGIGPGAHGRISLQGTLHATRRHRAPEIWAQRVEQSGHGLTADEAVPVEDRAREALLMGLRLTEGVDLARFNARVGRSVAQSVDPVMLTAAVDAGYIEQTAERLIATQDGRLRLDALLAALVL